MARVIDFKLVTAMMVTGWQVSNIYYSINVNLYKAIKIKGR